MIYLSLLCYKSFLDMYIEDLESLSMIVVKRLIELYPNLLAEWEQKCDAVFSSVIDFLSLYLTGQDAIKYIIR